MVRHAWLVSVLDQIVSANLGPNVSRLSERLLAVFERAGFDLWEAEKALKTVMPYVTAVAMMEAAFHTWLARHGTTEQAWLEEANRVAEEVTQAHPRLRELDGRVPRRRCSASMDGDFEYGLARVLDGLQARLEQPSAGTTTKATSPTVARRSISDACRPSLYILSPARLSRSRSDVAFRSRRHGAVLR